jgi:hypothetical protein
MKDIVETKHSTILGLSKIEIVRYQYHGTILAGEGIFKHRPAQKCF